MGAMIELPKLYHPDFAVPNRKPVGHCALSTIGQHILAGYLFNERLFARDITGKYHGTYNGDANEPVFGVNAMVGRYLDFSAASDNGTRFNIDSAALRSRFDGTKPFTLIAHANTDETFSNMCVFSIDGTDDFIWYLSERSERYFRVFWRDVTSTLSFSRATPPYTYLNRWNVYAYTFDGTDKHKLFINGDLVASVTASAAGAGPYTSGPAIGAWVGSNQYYRDDLASFFILDADMSAHMRALGTNLYGTLFSPSTPYLLPVTAGGGGYTLSCDSGGYSLTGSVVSLSASRKLSANSGSYGVTGTNASLKASRALSANSGSYSLSGAAAALKADRKLVGDSGSYALSGTNAGLTAARKLSAQSGTYSLTGTSVVLTYNPVSGNYTLVAESGSYVLSGTPAGLIKDSVLPASSGTYSVSGTSATLNRGFILNASSGAYALSGTSVSFVGSRVLKADSGSYLLSGASVSFSYSGAVLNEPSHYFDAPLGGDIYFNAPLGGDIYFDGKLH